MRSGQNGGEWACAPCTNSQRGIRPSTGAHAYGRALEAGDAGCLTSRAGSGPPVPLSVPLLACTTQNCLRPAPAPAGTPKQPGLCCCCLQLLTPPACAEAQRANVLLPASLQPRSWVSVGVQNEGVCSSMVCWWRCSGERQMANLSNTSEHENVSLLHTAQQSLLLELGEKAHGKKTKNLLPKPVSSAF